MKLFGTDGVRGKVNQYPMTPETVLRIGMAAAQVLKKRHGQNKILIGKDTRISGYLIESALTSGICSMGMNVVLVGPLPTPGVAYLTRAMRLDAGIVISASHNPYYDNGIKFFGPDGYKLPDHIEEEIESLVLDDAFPSKKPEGDQIGKAYRLEDASGRYIEFVKSTIPRGSNLEGLRVVVDCANGSAYKITPELLSELGAEVHTINDHPDGININHCCGSTDLTSLKEEVLRLGAHVGVAHDGDADRTLFIDGSGRVVDGDQIMAAMAVELKKRNALPGDTLVTTVMSNLGMEHYLNRKGIRVLRTKVGDRYVVEKMLEGGYTLGGEQSGHIVFLDYNSTGDGPITALQILYLLKKKSVALSDLVSDIFLYPQVLENVKVKNKGIIRHETIRTGIKEAEAELGTEGRLLVRASGTEPLIRIMAEGKDREKIEAVAKRLARLIRKTEKEETKG